MARNLIPENEFDNVRKSAPRQNYEDVKDLTEAYERNGFGKLDTIPHRLMVTVLDDVLEDLHKAKREAEDKREYQKAELLRKKIRLVQRQFGEKQMWQVTDQQRREVSQMDKAKEILSKTFKETWRNKKHEAVMENLSRKRILEETHSREKKELEKKISRLPPPVATMSKELVSYVTLEKHMRKNGQYQDASVLAKKIEKIAPMEQRQAERRFKAKIDETRKKLNEKHEEERKQLFEHSKAALIRVRDNRKIAANINKQNMKMHSTALNHALKLEMNEPSGWKRTVRPTVEKRAHFYETTSTRRGTQVLESVANARLFAPKLSEMHEFENEPDCMIDYETYAERKSSGFIIRD